MESAMSAIQVAVASNDALKVIDSVQRFHLCILEKTGNPLLLDIGKRLIVPLLAFTRMRVQARNLDASPWVPEVSNHQRILDALRMGGPHLAEQSVVHITGLFRVPRQFWRTILISLRSCCGAACFSPAQSRVKRRLKSVARGGCFVARTRYFCLRSNCSSDFPPYF
jgi:hypothetical protein